MLRFVCISESCAPFQSLYAPFGETFALKVRCWGLDPLMLQYRDAFWDPAPLTLQFCDASGGRAQLNLLLSGIRTLRFNLEAFNAPIMETFGAPVMETFGDFRCSNYRVFTLPVERLLHSRCGAPYRSLSCSVSESLRSLLGETFALKVRCSVSESLRSLLGETFALKVRCSVSESFGAPMGVETLVLRFGVFTLPAWRDFCTQGAVLRIGVFTLPAWRDFCTQGAVLRIGVFRCSHGGGDFSAPFRSLYAPYLERLLHSRCGAPYRSLYAPCLERLLHSRCGAPYQSLSVLPWGWRLSCSRRRLVDGDFW
ncbi:hypothetical protein LWI29_033858 [Acer saccharum]|uniref:Uncharacterized protein n=1 Tax=Acer saccharum TaxID=4024 RepID=A0AA39VR78_ACESA|nr:hypothetical protein LWI29_033858 [Acer saccharum]